LGARAGDRGAGVTTVALIVFTAAVFARVLVAVLGRDAAGWLPYLSAAIIRRAARRLPEPDASRWAEEALRHNQHYRDRPLTGLVHAIDMFRSVGELLGEIADEAEAEVAQPAQIRRTVPTTSTFRSAILSVTREPDMAVMSIQGEADHYFAPDFKATMLEELAAGIDTIIVDYTRTSYLDSDNLAVLVGGVKRTRSTGGVLIVVAPSRDISKIFEITGLDRVFPIYDTVVEARAAVRERTVSELLDAARARARDREALEEARRVEGRRQYLASRRPRARLARQLRRLARRQRRRS
jgi:anti-sigma B factor antagonist